MLEEILDRLIRRGTFHELEIDLAQFLIKSDIETPNSRFKKYGTTTQDIILGTISKTFLIALVYLMPIISNPLAEV